jgi:hypothetical protein
LAQTIAAVEPRDAYRAPYVPFESTRVRSSRVHVLKSVPHRAFASLDEPFAPLDDLFAPLDESFAALDGPFAQLDGPLPQLVEALARPHGSSARRDGRCDGHHKWLTRLAVPGHRRDQRYRPSAEPLPDLSGVISPLDQPGKRVVIAYPRIDVRYLDSMGQMLRFQAANQRLVSAMRATQIYRRYLERRNDRTGSGNRRSVGTAARSETR